MRRKMRSARLSREAIFASLLLMFFACCSPYADTRRFRRGRLRHFAAAMPRFRGSAAILFILFSRRASRRFFTSHAAAAFFAERVIFVRRRRLPAADGMLTLMPTIFHAASFYMLIFCAAASAHLSAALPRALFR